MSALSLRSLLRSLGLASLLWPCSAARAELIPFEFTNNSGGLNDGSDPVSIADNEASSLQNIVFNTGGSIVKRSGYVTINSTAISANAVFTGLQFFKLSSGTRYLVASTIDGATSRLWNMPYGAGTSGPTGTWSNITGSLSLLFDSAKHASLVAVQDRLLMTDGVGSNPIYVWTGTGNATTLGGGSPNAGCVEYHKNIAWASCNSTNPSTLYFSNVGDVTTWTATDTLAINTNDGQTIRALKSALDCLYVFKEFSIFRVCGTDRDSLTTEQMVSGIGTLSPVGVQVINNQFIFPTAQGQVAVYDGGYNIQIISAKIQGTINALSYSRFDNMVSAALEDATGNINYYLGLSDGGSGTNNLVLLYDTAHRAWTKFSGLSPSAMGVYELGTFQHALMFGNYTGTAFRYPSGNSDNGAAINAFYITKWFSFPSIPQDKVWRLLYSFLTQTGAYTMTVSVASDFGPFKDYTVSLNGTGSLWDTAVWDTDTWADLTTLLDREEVDKQKQFFQVKFSDNSTSPAFTVKLFKLFIEPSGRT